MQKNDPGNLTYYRLFCGKKTIYLYLSEHDSCNADSGGPLVFKELSSDPWVQVGIFSFRSKNCGSKGFPGVYTKVAAFMDWIISKLED